jgi:energy-coupling factor transporter ATP-binding protein EcfA2
VATANVPVLLFTGPVGVGKSTVAAEASGLLSEASVAHALVDLAQIGGSWPAPPDDPWNERVVHRNLACMWPNFQAVGAGRLLLSRVLEARSLLQRIAEAVPGAEITVVRLRAPVDVLHARINGREAGRNADWYLNAAAELAESMERDRVEDFCVDNVDRPAKEVAAEALRLIGWLDASAGLQRPFSG